MTFVQHPKFGPGAVISEEGDLVRVHFMDGEVRCLKASLANLQPIECPDPNFVPAIARPATRPPSNEVGVRRGYERCARCGAPHDRSYASGKFCSSLCAHTTRGGENLHRRKPRKPSEKKPTSAAQIANALRANRIRWGRN